MDFQSIVVDVSFLWRISVTPEQALGRYLRDLRLDREWSLEDLAKRSGISRSFLSLIENGRQGISLKSLYKLSVVLNHTMSSILDKSGYQEIAEIESR